MIGEDPYAGAAQPGAATGPGRRSGPAVPTRQAAPPAAAGAAGNLVDVLFRAHALTLVRMALLLVGDQSSAEDVVQGAFLGLCQGPGESPPLPAGVGAERLPLGVARARPRAAAASAA